MKGCETDHCISHSADIAMEKEGGMPGGIYFFIEVHIFPNL